MTLPLDYTCSHSPKVKAIALVKKGMAAKAFEKYVVTGDIKNIQRQVKKGVVNII